MFSKIANSTNENNNNTPQKQQKTQWKNGIDFPENFDFIQWLMNDVWSEQQNKQNRKKPKKQQQKKKNEKNGDDKKYNYMPVVAVQFIQDFEQNSIEYQNCGQHGINTQKGKTIFWIFTKLINDVLMKDKKVRRNKRFLRMLFNDVNEELNGTIKKGKMTRAEKEYFGILDDYDQELVNAAKSQLRFVFERAMAERRIELFAMNKQFRVEKVEKQKHLLKYLMRMKFELGKSEISGSVDGNQVEDFFDFE